MRVNKRTLFQLHSWIGIKLSLLFFIVCFSGTLATLSNEMDWLFHPGLRATGSGDRVPYNTIVQEVQQAYPNHTLSYWLMPKEPYLNDILYLEKDGYRTYVFADPFTGKVTGATKVTFQRFFRDFHYYLFMPFYQIGYFMVLVFAFLLAISLGTALLFYKKWWRKFLELKRSSGKLVLFRSLHRLVGLWSIPFVMVFSLTGIWYFTERTNLGKVSDISNPAAPKLDREVALDSADQTPFPYRWDYDMAAKVALHTIPGLEIRGIVPPRQPSSTIYLRGKSQVPLVRNRANRVYVDPLDYEAVGVQKAEDIPTIMYLNDIADPLHFGNWGGLTSKIIWFISGLGISGLVLTGIWIALRRQLKKSGTKKNAVMGAWKYINWLLAAPIFAYLFFFMHFRYGLSWEPILLVATILASVGWLAWYVFVTKMRQAR